MLVQFCLWGEFKITINIIYTSKTTSRIPEKIYK